MTEHQKSLLLELAAEMVLAKGMPPEFVCDWHLPKSTPVGTRREIQRAISQTLGQCRRWGVRIKQILEQPE